MGEESKPENERIQRKKVKEAVQSHSINQRLCKVLVSDPAIQLVKRVLRMWKTYMSMLRSV